MPLSLEQYASYLDTRDLPWPVAPPVDKPKARPHLVRLPEVRVVLYNIYGTLLGLAGGELWFEHPQEFVMSVALEKTIQEFKMWGSMSRKPGQPSEYMGQIYNQVLTDQRLTSGGGEKHPEVSSEKVWEAILKKLLQKDYKFDAGFFGSLNEYSRKIAYFFHASLQGTAAYPTTAEALQTLNERGITQGLLGDGQCFTLIQVKRALAALDKDLSLDEVINGPIVLSHEIKGRKPSERLYRQALDTLAEQNIEPREVLHVGSRIQQDLVVAKRLGMRTALFAGDKASLQATPEQMKEASSRPDLLLTDLVQLTQVVGTSD